MLTSIIYKICFSNFIKVYIFCFNVDANMLVEEESYEGNSVTINVISTILLISVDLGNV